MIEFLRSSNLEELSISAGPRGRKAKQRRQAQEENEKAEKQEREEQERENEREGLIPDEDGRL